MMSLAGVESSRTHAGGAIAVRCRAGEMAPGSGERKDTLLAVIASLCRGGSSAEWERLGRWAASFEPRGACEEQMFDQIVGSAERLEGVRCARVEWRLKHVKDSAMRDETEINRLGSRLLFDPRAGTHLQHSTILSNRPRLARDCRRRDERTCGPRRKNRVNGCWLPVAARAAGPNFVQILNRDTFGVSRIISGSFG